MRIANALNLPAPLVHAIAHDDYSRGSAHISVTQLIAPPRMIALERAHDAELVEDASDRIWLLLGKVAHGILQRAARADANALTEERLSIEVDGWEVSGAFDHAVWTADDGLLQDYKVTSVWSVKDGAKPEWEQQLNLYALLLREAGFPVRRAEIVAILRDWRKNEALRYGSSHYPERQVAVVPVELWSEVEQWDFLLTRVAAHQAALQQLPYCTAEERWERPTVFAVMRQGRKSAVKLYDDAQAATIAAKQEKLGYVETRPGVSVRCSQYCGVRQFCEAQRDGQPYGASEVGE